jgi:hypothetical protein
MPADATAAVGFAPHSGWAAAVGVGETGGEPRVLMRRRLEMADAGDPKSRQPYHAVEGLPVAEARKRLEAFEAKAGQMAYEGLAGAIDELEKSGHRVVGVGVLESSGRKGSSLEATLASHALIHTADGDHFRRALADAAARCRLRVSRVRAWDLDTEASAAIGRTPRALRRALDALGREVGPPWASDQKSAALLAWLVLERGRR